MTTVAALTPRAQRRAAARAREQYLITADEHSLPELERVLSALPLCSSGRVFIEVPDAADIAAIAAPARMTVTWLPRSRRSGAPGSGLPCAPGTAVSRAARAWADEMIDVEASEGPVRVVLLGGYLGTADILEHLTEARGLDAADIVVPERFGLSR